MGKEVFVVNEANFFETAERIRETLAERKVAEREIGQASLLLEELFFRVRGMGVEEMRVTVQSRLGDLSLRLVFGGEEKNPLTDVVSFDEDDVETFRAMILKAIATSSAMSDGTGKISWSSPSTARSGSSYTVCWRR